MTDSADERTKVDRTRDPEDPARDVREEYTGYRRDRDRDNNRPDRGKADDEARREAELQPGAPESDEEDSDGAGGP